ncbi:MAG: ATP-binding protein, partial [Bacteroidales bacterium]|nr:ATP-binding protein [Bacteroidales bacterium]
MAVNRDTSSFFRLVFFLVALIIIAASTWFSNDLGKELAAEEQKKIELWAEAIRLLAQEPQPGEEDVRFDYTLTLKVIEGNTNIPVILTDGDNNVQSYANLNLSKKHPEADLENKAAHLIQKNRHIQVKLDENTYQYVYYDDSDLLKKLRYFPFVQLG